MWTDSFFFLYFWLALSQLIRSSPSILRAEWISQFKNCLRQHEHSPVKIQLPLNKKAAFVNKTGVINAKCEGFDFQLTKSFNPREIKHAEVFQWACLCILVYGEFNEAEIITLWRWRYHTYSAYWNTQYKYYSVLCLLRPLNRSYD